MGVDADRIDAFVAASQSDDDSDQVTVWPENAAAFEVFCRCGWQYQSVNDGQRTYNLPSGIAAAEIRDVADMLAVPRERWAQVLDDVRFMASVVLPALQRV